MRVRTVVSLLLVSAAVAWLLCAEIAMAQVPGRGSTPAAPVPALRTTSRAATRAPGRQVHANLAQLMRGILFPNSNVIFAAQSQDPASIKPDEDPSMSTNPLASVFGGWQAVENSGLALAEAANLLSIPGRTCSNGRPVPVLNADWAKFVRELRAAGIAAYNAGQSKNQDAILEVSDRLTTACENCHAVYRDKTSAQGGPAIRCLK